MSIVLCLIRYAPGKNQGENENDDNYRALTLKTNHNEFYDIN